MWVIPMLFMIVPFLPLLTGVELLGEGLGYGIAGFDAVIQAVASFFEMFGL